MSRPAEPIELAPPGAGLPPLERWLLRYALMPLLSHTHSWERADALFVKEARRIKRSVETVPATRLTERVLVNRPLGIEDSSRHWSVAMTLEHLVAVGRGIAQLVIALSHDRDPSYEVDIVDFKPRGQLGPDAPAVFDAFVAEYLRQTSEEVGARRRRRTHPHPWFGPLTAHAWHCLAGAHQGLHRRQIERIVAALRIMPESA